MTEHIFTNKGEKIMVEFTPEWIAKARNACILFGEPATTEFRKALDEIERLQKRVEELEQDKTFFQELANRWSKTYYKVTEDMKQRIAELEKSDIGNLKDQLSYAEELKAEVKVKKFRFYYDDLEVATFCVIETNCRKIIGMTVCHPKDKRDDYMGRKMAFTDAVSKLPYEEDRKRAWKKFFRKYPVPETRKKFGEE